MATHKLNDDDDRFVQVPADAVLMFAGASGTETWIERERDTTVRIIAKAVAVATAEGGTLEMCIEVKDGCAKGQDGPAPAEARLRASQSVQVVVKAGERLTFKAYPRAAHATVLRTVVSAAEVKPVGAEPEPAKEPPREQHQPA
jgi:hypothetical protein